MASATNAFTSPLRAHRSKIATAHRSRVSSRGAAATPALYASFATRYRFLPSPSVAPTSASSGFARRSSGALSSIRSARTSARPRVDPRRAAWQ